jgi:hypothetical protein
MAAHAQLIVIGDVGSDAGYWVLGPDGWHHVGGWGVDNLVEFQAQLQILAQSAKLKTPGLANRLGEALQGSISKILGEHVKNAGQSVVVIVNQG